MELRYQTMLTVRMPRELHEKLRQAADNEELSASDFVRDLIADRLED